MDQSILFQVGKHWVAPSNEVRGRLCFACQSHENVAMKNQATTKRPNSTPITSFVHKSRWFVASQTVGDDLETPAFAQGDERAALDGLQIQQIPFTETDGNCQGYAETTDRDQSGGPTSAQDTVSRNGPCHLRPHLGSRLHRYRAHTKEPSRSGS